MAQWMWEAFQKEEWIFLSLFIIYYVLIHCLYDKAFLKPMKLLGVFVHEMGHASATWITCGSVKNIEVYQNEGGITGFSGGWKPIIIPAGYVGGAFWGGCFVALSGFTFGSMLAAFIVSAALLVALCHKPNKTVVYISIGFSIITIAIVLIDWFVITPFLQYFTSFYGCFFGYYAVRDIWDDCVKVTREGSDASACHSMWKCCQPQCVGVQFLILGVLFQFIGIYTGLLLLMNNATVF